MTVARKQRRSRYSVDIVVESMVLIKLLCSSERLQSFTELSKRSGISKNKMFRILATLEQCGVVAKDGQGKYGIGAAAYGAACNALSNSRLLSRIRPVMAQLAEILDETVYFAIRTGKQLILIDMVECNRKIKVASFVGKEFHMASPGAETELIQGITVCHGSLDPEVTTISLELFDNNGLSQGALVVVSPTFRLTMEDIRSRILPHLAGVVQWLPIFPASRETKRVTSATTAVIPNTSSKYYATEALGARRPLPALAN